MTTTTIPATEIQALLSTYVGPQSHLNNEYRELLEKVISYIGNTSDVITVAELIPAVDSFIRSSKLIATGSNAIGLSAIFLFPVGAMINIINAYEAGLKMYSYRCIAYTLTSWAFDKPVLSCSPRIITNIRTGFPVQPESVILQYNKIWRETSTAVITQLNRETSDSELKKRAVKLMFQALGNGDPRYLCEEILISYTDKMSNIEKISWKALTKVPYPT